jgi:hypothetical protein
VWDNTHFFKDMATYVAEREMDRSGDNHGAPGSGYTPGYYYNQVWPLASSKVDCKDEQ